jgi:type II secretion system protein I
MGNVQMPLDSGSSPKGMKGNRLRREMSDRGGFTLLEVLVAISILAIAVAVILQLFSADLRAIALSENYVTASVKAEAKMREILDEENFAPRAVSETTYDGYTMDVTVEEVLTERTAELFVKVMEITLDVRWNEGPRERAITLKSLRTVQKEI